MTLGITAIGTAAGATFIDNMEQGAHFGRSADFITDKIGFCRLRRLGEGQTLLDLCREAVDDLRGRHPFDLSKIECLVLVTQNPAAGGLPHNSARLHGLLGLPRQCAAFDLSLGCSGYVYALSVMTGFMKKLELQRGLLFTADPYSSILNPDDASTSLLFGDAATCTYISDEPVYTEGKPALSTDGQLADALCILPESGKLHMDGQGIFNFVMRTAPKQIRQCLDNNNLSINDVHCFLLHHASRYIIENLTHHLMIPTKKVPFCLKDIGNTISSTLPFALQKVWDTRPSNILLSGFGVGLSMGTTVLFYHKG